MQRKKEKSEFKFCFASVTYKSSYLGKSSHCGSAITNPTSIHEDAGSISAPPSALRIWHCHELWYRSQMQLGSGVAVAVV